ncbi:MAG: FAD-binding oxidoreductase [Candidatus Hermodarchaeota archaeon]
MIDNHILGELENIVGDKHVSDQSEVTFLYDYDFVTAEPRGKCDIAIMPGSAEEVKQIVKIANKHKIPLIPWVSGMNFGSIATPRRGGIVVDLRRLNKVLEVNEDDMYAVIEGGITWATLKGYLEKNHPDLRAGITFSPPGTGVIPSYLHYGMYDLSMLGGSGAEFINGLEIVLGSGELIKVGSCSLSNYWYGRQPLPDLAGLFIGWEGTTGIVTKAAIKLWPKLPYRMDFMPLANKMEIGVPMLLKLSKTGLGICDLCCINLGWANSLQGFSEKSVVKDALEFNLPDFLGLITTQAYTEKQHEVQCEAIRDICNEFQVEALEADTTIKSFPQEMRGIMENMIPSTGGQTPFQFWNSWNFTRGGGGQYIGCYVSTREIVNYYYKSRSISIKYGKPPQFYSKILFGGHYCTARIHVNFNKNKSEEIENARKILKEIHETVQAIDGVVMYKPPLWAVEYYKSKTLPTTNELIKKIKLLLDPNSIMNPGQGIGED